MNLNKICIGLIVLLADLGLTCGNMSNDVYGAGTQIKENQSSVGFSQLTATIKVCVKNTANHVQYFKISQKYTDSLDIPINWTIDWTNPAASKMVDAVSPELGGNYGWKVNPGETKEVTFKVNAYGMFGAIPTYTTNNAAVNNTYWPTILDQGIMASWFQPNELKILNPTFDMRYWKGTFTFLLTNFDTHTVSGVIRAPIVPTDSKLTYSNPKATFVDKNLVLNGGIATWDVTIGTGASEWFTYTYEWPSSPSSVPTKETGLPYRLFIIGGILTVGGVVYSKYIK